MMYSGLQKGMSIVLIITFDTLEKILNFYYNPYIANMTIDDSLHPFLQSSVYDVLTVCEGTETEVTIATNFYRNCLMSFTSEPNIVQLSSNHLPLHFANIDDIDFYQFRNCYYRGIKVLKSNDGFSVVFLSNIGEIFIQNFYWNNTEVIAQRRSKKVTGSKGIGSSHLRNNR